MTEYNTTDRDGYRDLGNRNYKRDIKRCECGGSIDEYGRCDYCGCRVDEEE